MHFAHAAGRARIHSVSITAGAAAEMPAGAAEAAGTAGGTGPARTGAAPGTAGRAEHAASREDWAVGIGLMTGSAAAAQVGAAVAAQAFPVLGPVGVVAIRQWVAAGVMLATIRPKIAQFTARQWRPVLLLALVFMVMNTSLYIAIQRIGLGLAVTLEFLGPLSVALLASRRAVDYGCAVLAGAAAVVLARPQPSTDYLGIGLAVLAAAGWAGYITVNRVIGQRFADTQGAAVAIGISALLYLPAGIIMMASHPVTLVAVARAATAGVLCTIVPMVCDVRALRRIPARFYGVFMSVNPVLAALIGLAVLGQALSLIEWLAIAAIVTANAVSIAARS
jgi:inner membrane transporter RhtA